jgi:hypothetical protein
MRISRAAARAFVSERHAPFRVRLLRAYLIWAVLLVALMMLISLRAFRLTARPPTRPAEAPCPIHSKEPCH